MEYDENGDLKITFTDGSTQTIVMPDKHVHTFGEWTNFSLENVACENRLFYRVCTSCNSIEWKQGTEKDHKWQVVTTPSTCKEQGYDTKTCLKCGKQEIDNYQDLADHSWKIVTTKPTCKEQGYDTKTCLVCGEEEIDNYTGLSAHTWAKNYSYDANYHWFECSVCDAINGKQAHTASGKGTCVTCNAPYGEQNPEDAPLYTRAEDVKYVQVGNYIANWGERDEACVFLSKYATSFYTGSYSYAQMSLNAGGSSISNTPSSKLYKALQKMMQDEHSTETSYSATRDKFCYTDCERSKYSNISSFYSGIEISGTWDGGKTWNREHTWPNSKGDLAGNGENDIMMLRPASVSENSSRGNKAYGESSSYYDPNGEGQSVRGDCARIVLYQYVRWGCTNTGSKYNPTDIFGVNGVIQSLDVLLRWMQEDPVDTWEMGRNDAVQSITGTRNVFVDYPEYAWLLFGEEIPANYQTPSGKAKESSKYSVLRVVEELKKECVFASKRNDLSLDCAFAM